MTYKNFQARNHLEGAIESYEFLKRTFEQHLDTLGEREKRVLKEAKESIDFFREELKKTVIK